MLSQYKNIPATLKLHTNWVVWGVSGAPLKAPYNPARLLSHRYTPARAGIPETWGSYLEAAECVARGLARGIGYEFDGSGIYGVDLDNVIDKGGALMPEAKGIVSKLDSYTEISPSGAGLHVLVLAPGADIARHRKKGCFLCQQVFAQGFRD